MHRPSAQNRTARQDDFCRKGMNLFSRYVMKFALHYAGNEFDVSVMQL